jgi:hypothetical protein
MVATEAVAVNQTIWPCVMVCVGVYVTLVGFRWISPSKPTADPQKVEEWYRQYGWLMRIGGPLIVLFALWRLAMAYGLL